MTRRPGSRANTPRRRRRFLYELQRYRAPRFGPTPHLCYLYRKALDLTQHQAARDVRVSMRAWQYYEAGERRPPRRVLDQIVAALNA